MLIFGAAVGQKLIYRIPNPSEETPFKNYYLTKVRQTNFRSSIIGKSDYVSLSQVRFNQLKLKHANIFTQWDDNYFLNHSLRLANNIVPFNLNALVHFERSGDCEYFYPPNLPLELLGNQSILNTCIKNVAELRNILHNIQDPSHIHLGSGLDRILETYLSSTKEV